MKNFTRVLEAIVSGSLRFKECPVRLSRGNIAIFAVFVVGAILGIAIERSGITGYQGPRACVNIAENRGPVTKTLELVFEPDGSVYMVHELDEAPDLRQVELSEETEFLARFAHLDATRVYTNALMMIRGDGAFVLAGLNGDQLEYARENLLVFIEDTNENWLSVETPDFC